MGDVASILRTLSCQDCARYVCNSASIHSQCCNEESRGCDCDCETREVSIAEEPDIEISVEDDGCWNCLFSRSK